MRRASLIVVGIAWFVLGPMGHAQEVGTPEATSLVPRTSGVKVEILSIPTVVSGQYAKLLRDLGQSAEPLMAMLFYPDDGINQYSPGILIHHDGLGGHPARSTGPARFAAERLAAEGYTVLSIYSRHARHYRTVKFEETALDIQSGLDFLSSRGIQELILAGHGLGASRVTWYQASTQDPRVKAVVNFSPSDLHGEGSVVEATGLVQDYDQKLARAQRAVAAGRGGADRSADPDLQKGLAPDEWIFVADGVNQTAEAFLSFWGPEAKTRTSDWLPKIKTPILLLSGTNDPTVPAGRLEALAQSATASSKVDYRWYKGTNRFFEGVWDQVSDDVTLWLSDLELAPKSRIVTEVVDVAMGNGRYHPGILYTPAAGADPDKPVFLLQHGWTGDIVHSSNHWLGWRLAVSGYVVLAPESRVSGAQGIQKTGLAEVAEDLGLWVDFLESRGYDRVIMEGHSAGGIWISNYLSVSQDSRVIGMVYLAPTRDMPTLARDGMGEERYLQVLEEARAAVARGEGDSYLINHKYYAAAEVRFGPLRSVMNQLAGMYLEYWAPDSRAVHTDRVAEFDRPSLTIAGQLDGLMSKSFIEEFTSAHKGNAESRWYMQGSHGLRESKPQVLADVIEWTQRTFPDN